MSYDAQTMKFGLSVHRLHRFGFEPHLYQTLVRSAEELGFESIWVGDHLVFPEVMPSTDPSPSGIHESSQPWLDPLITLTYLAAATKRVRLATDVYVLPLRNPFVTAKTVATLDILSQGRVTLGVGVGWCEPEFRAVGEDFHTRGHRCEEIMDILEILWTRDPGEALQFHGRYYSFESVRFEPKPLQKPRPPIHYGGFSSIANRRAAKRCDGFVAAARSFEETSHQFAEIQEYRRRFERDHLPFEFSAKLVPPVTVDAVEKYRELGIDRVIFRPWPHASGQVALDGALREMERFAEVQNLMASST